MHMTRTPVVDFLELCSVALTSERFSIYLTNTTKPSLSIRLLGESRYKSPWNSLARGRPHLKQFSWADTKTEEKRKVPQPIKHPLQLSR